jgi:hypothetical protein
LKEKTTKTLKITTTNLPFNMLWILITLILEIKNKCIKVKDIIIIKTDLTESTDITNISKNKTRIANKIILTINNNDIKIFFLIHLI